VKKSTLLPSDISGNQNVPTPATQCPKPLQFSWKWQFFSQSSIYGKRQKLPAGRSGE